MKKFVRGMAWRNSEKRGMRAQPLLLPLLKKPFSVEDGRERERERVEQSRRAYGLGF